MAVLEGPRAAAKSGQTKSLVILLHGYGADGNDLFGLAEPLSQYMPDTAFRAPNAPERSTANPMGYQWFPIPMMDGSTEEQRDQGFHKSVDLLNAYIDEAMAEEGVAAEQTVLVGFSQGTMMSLHVAPRRDQQIAGIVGFSGRMAQEVDEPTEIKTRPPVVLIHGDQDQMIPVEKMHDAEKILTGNGFQVQTHISPGVGHGIGQDGLTLALQFMMAVLSIQPPERG